MIRSKYFIFFVVSIFLSPVLSSTTVVIPCFSKSTVDGFSGAEIALNETPISYSIEAILINRVIDFDQTCAKFEQLKINGPISTFDISSEDFMLSLALRMGFEAFFYLDDNENVQLHECKKAKDANYPSLARSISQFLGSPGAAKKAKKKANSVEKARLQRIKDHILSRQR